MNIPALLNTRGSSIRGRPQCKVCPL